MRQLSFIALMSVFALFIGGCPASDDASVAPSPVASPVPVPATPTAAATPFANPVTPPKPANPQAVAGLVQSSVPDAVVQQIDKGRSDPFVSLPVPVRQVVPPNPRVSTAPRRVPVLPQIPRSSSANAGSRSRGGNVLPAPRVGTGAGVATSRGVRSSGGGTGTGGAFSIPLLPQLPDPALARGIEVTGVVEVGGVPNAIVKVPNEPSRYVRAGQRLSNGQVLVKRIEMNRGPVPVVILEQYGVEVARRVGDQPAGGSGEPGSPTASLPALRLVNMASLPQG